MSKSKLQAARALRAAERLTKQNEELLKQITTQKKTINVLMQDLDLDKLKDLTLPPELQSEMEKLTKQIPETSGILKPKTKKRRNTHMERI